ncbi:Uncharacterised protein [Legionella busanensis]|uniref:Uncharacterized protein n=1 Tax=Legionella busanensis TaxID=190655 RepID=A0A378JKI9_9GAMM|nr:hypothetical protein [Legionella busanensis]STX50640.1 Uncharacterised protein [Legionella busanensis]
MPAELTFNKNDEYFLSIAKQEHHSFLMLGVIQNNTPTLLARVGKTNDIDPDIQKRFKPFYKNLTTGTLARLADERLTRKSAQKDDITYQAYTITYEQMKEFLDLIAYIEEKQLTNEEIKNAINKTYKKKSKKEEIQAYIPIQEVRANNLTTNSNQVVFEFKKLREYEAPKNISLQNLGPAPQIVNNMNRINVSNTCRHSAVDILESVLHYKTNASKQFFIPLSYHTKLIGGIPDKQSFYILPPPPTSYKPLTTHQLNTLNKLYGRLKKIPKLHCHDLKTRMKFDELKDLYNRIAGASKLSASDLLLEISRFENDKKDILFQQRSNHFISFFSPHSATEKTLQKIKANLGKEHNNYSTENNTMPMP